MGGLLVARDPHSHSCLPGLSCCLPLSSTPLLISLFLPTYTTAQMSEPAITSNGNNLNPFSRRDEFSSQSILFYKISTSISYLLLLVTAFYYAFNAPHEAHDGRHKYGWFWQHNHETPFAQSKIITSIYWVVLFILQLFYASTLR